MLKKQIVCRFEVGIFNFYCEEQIKTYPYFLKSIYGHSWRHPSSDVATVRTHFFGPIEKGDFIKGSPLPQGMYYCLKKTFVDSTVSGVNLIFFFFAKFFSNIEKNHQSSSFWSFFFFFFEFCFGSDFGGTSARLQIFFPLTFANFTWGKRKASWFWWKIDNLAPLLKNGVPSKK